MPAEDVGVVLAAYAAEELEGDDQADDAYTAAGEHALRGDLPRGVDEACVYRLPVPEHLPQLV